MSIADTAALVLELSHDPVLANKLLFAKRHPKESAPFHPRMIAALTSSLPQVLVKAFRGSAKSTTAEEVMVQGGIFNAFNYGVIVGSTYDRACDRLKTIKHEMDFNERLLTMFGTLQGEQWGSDTIILSSGVMLKAIGRGQSVRGLKEAHRNSRPDFVLFDDLEEEETGSEKKRVDGTEVWRWIYRVLKPALAENARLRWVGTPLGENCALEMAASNPDWRTLDVPLYTGAGDDIEPAWPSVFPRERCLAIRDEYERAGDLAGFSQEYLCKSMDNIARTFHEESIIVSPAATTSFAPKTLIVDPARTTNLRSSRTGYVVTSWVGSSLIVHHAQGSYHTPSQQVDTIFSLADAFTPGTVAVEKDGLEEWLMQPLRAQMTLRGDVLPIEGIKAPRDKPNFIKGLQPFFNAREVQWVQDFPDLRQELLNFPYGKLDVVNALAYAIRLRPGAPVYPMFSERHIAHFVPGLRGASWLCLNGSPGLLAAVLVVVQDGRLHVMNDWVREGSMVEMLQSVAMDMNTLPAGFAKPQILIPVDRAAPTDQAALGVALTRERIQYRTGGRIVENLECLADAMRQTQGGQQMFTVSPEATWTLNALAGGYCRDVHSALVLTPKDNISRTVAQALESLGRMSGAAALRDENLDELNGVTRTGRAYRSMIR